MKIFNKILIANRGEIACRIIRTAKEMGIKTVAIYSEADAKSLHVRMADEAHGFDGNELIDTYLNVEKIIEFAKKSKAEAIHPGYGFLAENPDLVAACKREGISFIGPSVKAIELMGNKIAARKIVKNLGIPMTEGAVGSIDEIIEKSIQIPLPLLVKAAAGGGGKGMRIVRDREKLRETIESTSREAKAYFGDGQVYVEQYIEEPRHIEIQVIGDKFGNVIHLYERECSIQRRYQKIIEESPSPTLNQEVRTKMGDAAVAIAANIGYDSAGTIEFLVDKNLNFYFLEMNTRIQVEHPVTEMVTGIDIVRQQIEIAAGNQITIHQTDIKQKGHAIEARIYAEDPEIDFMPSPGTIFLYNQPKGQNIRVDSSIDGSATIHSFYDPMIAKLITWGNNREESRIRLISALEDFVVHGLKTNIAYLYQLLLNQDYINNNISTKYCDEHTKNLVELIHKSIEEICHTDISASFLAHHLISQGGDFARDNIWGKIGFWRLNPIIEIEYQNQMLRFEILKQGKNHIELQSGERKICLKISTLSQNHIQTEINGKSYKLFISTNKLTNHCISFLGKTLSIRRNDELYEDEFYVAADSGGDDSVRSPMPGKVIKVFVQPGQKVQKGDILVIVEAMKMENNLEAHRDAEVDEVFVLDGNMVENSKVLLTLKPTSE